MRLVAHWCCRRRCLSAACLPPRSCLLPAAGLSHIFIDVMSQSSSLSSAPADAASAANAKAPTEGSSSDSEGYISDEPAGEEAGSTDALLREAIKKMGTAYTSLPLADRLKCKKQLLVQISGHLAQLNSDQWPVAVPACSDATQLALACRAHATCKYVCAHAVTDRDDAELADPLLDPTADKGASK